MRFKEYLSEIAVDSGAEHLYHVTHTKHVAKIKKEGLLPFKTSNYKSANGKEEHYGKGSVHAFTHEKDAHRWAAKMDWDFNKTMGSGKISVLKIKNPKEHKWEVDHNDPLSQSGNKGKWIRGGAIKPEHIVDSYPVTSDHLRKLNEESLNDFLTPPFTGTERRLNEANMKSFLRFFSKKKGVQNSPKDTSYNGPDRRKPMPDAITRIHSASPA